MPVEQIQGDQGRKSVLCEKKLALMLGGEDSIRGANVMERGQQLGTTGSGDQSLISQNRGRTEETSIYIGGNLGIQADSGGPVRRMGYSSLLLQPRLSVWNGIPPSNLLAKLRSEAFSDAGPPAHTRSHVSMLTPRGSSNRFFKGLPLLKAYGSLGVSGPMQPSLTSNAGRAMIVKGVPKDDKSAEGVTPLPSPSGHW